MSEIETTEKKQISEGEIREAVQQVYIWRKSSADIDFAVSELKKRWEQDNVEILSLQKQNLERVSLEENRLRIMAVNFFKETNNKKPCPGVEVKEYEVLYYDEKLAKNWVLEKRIDVALKLNKKLFEDVASKLDIDFVEIKREPRATIATDLGKILNNNQS